MTLLIAIIISVLGAVLGSFFNVLIDRVPRGESVVNPPSHCTSCGKQLPPGQNIPIYTYLAQKGKCRSCGAKIPWHHLAVEIATPLLFLALFLVYGVESLSFWKFTVMFGFLIPIFFIDAFHKIIPLVLSVPMVVAGLVLGFIQSGYDFMNFFWVYLLPALGLFALLYLLALAWEKFFHKEGLGGGDVILIPAVAAFFGAIHIPFVILLACLMGILYFLLFIRKPEQAFAFGNFIALAAVIWALAGEPLMRSVGLI
ncbi:MAG TPA: prepilin peptidase [Candidatus Syntrophosphaera sp.]|nr:prepilin peptidase [Candidatus Syntrophosphaera sp.]HPH61834.1 prepilin peptidase [Candidatus Syntrophosphaera sp.]